MKHEFTERSASDRNSLRRSTLLHAAAIVVIALLSVASYAVLDRALQVQREATALNGLMQSQAMLSQRVASLLGQYALGAAPTRRELQIDLSAMETNERLIRRDPALSAVFAGAAPLDVAIGDFVKDARRASAISAADPGFKQAAGRVFSAAQAPLIGRLNAAIAAQESRTQRLQLRLGSLGIAVALTLLATLLGEAFGIYRPVARRARRMEDAAAELARVATTDPLTGMLNRRGFQDRGAIEINKARRYNRPLSLLMIDPDHLGAINKAHGEWAGEMVLKALTASLFDGTRTTDLVGRVGGEEVAILLPETDRAGAEMLAERLRRRISDLAVPLENSIVSCTVSIGVAAAEKGASLFGPTFARADEALYEAKMRGRNRVFVNAA